jgi:hypothetical protein
MQDVGDEQPRTVVERERGRTDHGGDLVEEVYTTPGVEPTADRGVGRRTVIEAAKAAVPVIDLADRLCGPGQMRRIGEKWTARCPLPDHDEKTPSFTVYPGERGWWCYGCQRGGDVVDLAQAAWGIDRADVAAAEALMTFGHEIPARPAAWFNRQERQAPIRARIESVRTEVLMRRLFRFVFEPMISAIEDPNERAEMAADLWRDALPLAARMAEDRRGAE